MSYLGLETIRRGYSSDCIRDILTLHFPNAKTVLDCTYGKGRFWQWDHQLAITGVDIDPIDQPGIIRADYKALPFLPQSFDVMVFDPPFIFSPGISRIMGTRGFIRGVKPLEADKNERWTATNLVRAKNPQDLLTHHRRIFEQRYIARQGLILKGQDLIVNKPDWWSFNVMELARAHGMGMPADVLLQYSKAARMKDPRWKVQKHFRRSHAIYLIYKW